MFNIDSKNSPVLAHVWNFLTGYKECETKREPYIHTSRWNRLELKQGFELKYNVQVLDTHTEPFTAAHPILRQPWEHPGFIQINTVRDAVGGTA